MLIFLLLVQIITESLPISSSGHVAMAQAFLKQHGYDVMIPQALLWLVHGITAFLMVLIMVRYWMPLLRHPWRIRGLLMRMMLYGVCAELLTAVIYLSLHGLVAHFSLVPGFLITMVVLFSLQCCHTARGYSCFVVWMAAGIAQGVAVIPGCSRLALTYATARWLGYSERHALLLSFTLALPPFISASLYGAYAIVAGACETHSSTSYELAVIMCGSLLAYGALYMTWYLMLHDRAYYFAWYMMLVLLLTTSLFK